MTNKKRGYVMCIVLYMRRVCDENDCMSCMKKSLRQNDCPVYS